MSDFDMSQLAGHFKPNDIINAPFQASVEFEKVFLDEMDGYLRSLQVPQADLTRRKAGPSTDGAGSDGGASDLESAMKEALQSLRQNDMKNLRLTMASHSYRIMTQTLVKIVDSFTEMLKRMQQS